MLLNLQHFLKYITSFNNKSRNMTHKELILIVRDLHSIYICDLIATIKCGIEIVNKCGDKISW